MRTLKAKTLALYCTLNFLVRAFYTSVGISSLVLTALVSLVFKGLYWPVVLLSMIPCSAILILHSLTLGKPGLYVSSLWKIFLAASCRQFDVYEPIEKLLDEAHTALSTAEPISFNGEASMVRGIRSLLYIDRGKLRLAKDMAEKELRGLTADSGVDVLVSKLNLVAALEVERGNCSRAITLAQRAEKILENNGIENGAVLRTAQLTIGMAHAYEHRFDKAAKILTRVAADLKNERTEDFLGKPGIGILSSLPIQSDRALVMLARGKLARLNRDYKKAESILLAGLKYTRKNRLGRFTKLTEPEFLLELAFISYANGSYQRAKKLFNESIACYTTGRPYQGPCLARAYVGLARVYLAQGRTEGVEKLLSDAQSIQQFELNPGHPDMAERIVARGELCKLNGLNVDAKMLYKRAVEMLQKLYGRGDLDLADGQFALGQVCGFQGSNPEAQSNLAHALETYSDVYGNGHARTAAVRKLLERLEANAQCASGPG